jgi:hypothetical protein
MTRGSWVVRVNPAVDGRFPVPEDRNIRERGFAMPVEFPCADIGSAPAGAARYEAGQPAGAPR